MAVAARRECVRALQARGLSERAACRLADVSSSVLRYVPREGLSNPSHPARPGTACSDPCEPNYLTTKVRYDSATGR